MNRIFTGAVIDSARLFEQHLYLGFDNQRALKLACVPGMPYAHAVEHRFIPIKRSRDWHINVLRGSVLSAVKIIPGDRILEFTFESGHRIIFELTGRHANIILVSEDGIIRGALRPVTEAHSGIRQIRQGIPYEPPPERVYPDPVWSPPTTLTRYLAGGDMPLDAALANNLYAGSQIFAREVLARSGTAADIHTADLGDDLLLAIYREAARLSDRIEHGGSGGTIVYDSGGIPRDVFPVLMTVTGPHDVHMEDIDDAVEQYARERERGLELLSLRRGILAALKREEKSLTRTRKKVLGECDSNGEAEQLEQLGNIILANIHRIPRGSSEITVDNMYDGREVTIELDPLLDPPANAERLFTRARKLRAAKTLSEERLRTIDRRLSEIESERSGIPAIGDIRQLRSIASQYERQSGRDRYRDSDQPFPRRFRTTAGLEVIIGRNDRENDELVRWANKNDTWMHAQGVGGSHVILHHGKQAPDRRSIDEAAAAAAYYSKAKTSAIVPVVHTLVKYVVKRKGQGPGQVTYTREKVIFAEPGAP